MDLIDYCDRVAHLTVGKKVRNAVYVHADALRRVDSVLWNWLRSFADNANGIFACNVVKLDPESSVASFLYYPAFRLEAHPPLETSLTVYLDKGRSRLRSYRGSSNPPVLHRKETLLTQDDPDYATFSQLTLAEVQAGLYEHARTIGHRAGWERALEECGLSIKGHTLVAIRTEQAVHPKVGVMRHRTALTRRELSKPVQLLLSHGILCNSTTFLDYGCGQGDDVRFLREMGYPANGWDPVFFPNEPTPASDVVNLGYVLNVIEDVAERCSTLRCAFALARTVLCVSVLVGTADYQGRTRPFADGVLTGKATFQKYYQQEELSAFVEECTGVTPIPVSAGIVLVFKVVASQHAFLLQRVQRREVPTARVLPFRSTSVMRRALVDAFVQRHSDIWAQYGSFVREHGRPPFADESNAPTAAQTFGIQPLELFEVVRGEIGAALVEQAATRRKNEIMVFLAISRIRRLPTLSDLPVSFQHSIRFHFGSYRNAIRVSEDRLFVTGNRTTIAAMCSEAEVGVCNSTGYFVPMTHLEEIDPVLQIYARLGELFAGDLNLVHLVKIHTTSPKLSLFAFDDYENSEEPVLVTRVKIDLQSQQVRFFDHRSVNDPEVLVGKGLLERKADPREELGRQLLRANLPFGLIVRKCTIKSYSQ